MSQYSTCRGATGTIRELVAKRPAGCSRRAGDDGNGAYALNGGTSNTALMAVTRSPTGTWVIQI